MKIAAVVGTRPEIVKIAPVVWALSSVSEAELKFVHTGQHYESSMSAQIIKDLGLKEPDIYLGVGSGSHAQQTARIMEKLESYLLREKPDITLVVGDTNSTLAGALASVKLKIPVAHIESGCRAFDMHMPEEVNRVLTDHCSQLLFAPTEAAALNLAQEGIPSSRVFLEGNTNLDSFIYAKPKAEPRRKCRALGLSPGEYVLLTLHRAENVDSKQTLKAILAAVSKIREPVVFPAHPRTLRRAREFSLTSLLESKPIVLIEPQPYMDFMSLLLDAKLVLTDSGGVQEEAAMAGVPCVTLRETTEWVETVQLGLNKLAGTQPERILEAYSWAAGASRSKLRELGSKLYHPPGAGSRIASRLLQLHREGRVRLQREGPELGLVVLKASRKPRGDVVLKFDSKMEAKPPSWPGKPTLAIYREYRRVC